MDSVFDWAAKMAHELVAKYPVAGLILAIVGVLVFVGQAIVVITPSKKDDEKLAELMSMSWFKKLVELLKSFAPWQKGSEGYEKSSESTK